MPASEGTGRTRWPGSCSGFKKAKTSERDRITNYQKQLKVARKS